MTEDSIKTKIKNLADGELAKQILAYIDELEDDLHKERIHRVSDVQMLELKLAMIKSRLERVKIMLSEVTDDN